MYLKKLQISYDKSEKQLSDTVPEGIYLGYITGIPAKIVTWYIKIVEKKDLNTFWRKKNLERFTEEFLEEPTVKCLWNHWLNNWRHCGMNSCKSECMNFWKKSWGPGCRIDVLWIITTDFNMWESRTKFMGKSLNTRRNSLNTHEGVTEKISNEYLQFLDT